MQISPIPALDDTTNEIRQLTAEIVANHIIPNEHFLRQPGEKRKALYRELQERVKKTGLWAPHLPEEYGGMGVGFMKHAYMNEILAWSPVSSGIFGVVAPNSGNQKILLKYGTEEQKRKWLEPLCDPDPGHARRRSVGDQWTQVVHLERPARRFRHSHVSYRAGRRRCRSSRQDDADHRPDRYPWIQHHP